MKTSCTNHYFTLLLFTLGMLQAIVHADPDTGSATATREAALDAQLGIDRTFPRINLTALRTHDQLRDAARIRTGLPAYDQQVEGASSAPAALLAQLQAPAAQRRSTQQTPQTSPAPAQDTQQQPNAPNCPITHVGPCF